MLNEKQNFGRCAALVLCAGATVAMLPGVALGQAAEDALRGPDVEHMEVPGGTGGFMDEEMRNPRERGQQVPHRLFMGALRTLENAPADLAVTREQRAEIEGILRGFEEERRAFMREHRDEIRALRGAAGGREGARRGARGNERGGDREQARERLQRGERPEMDPEMRERAQALREMAPKPEETHRAIFEVLTAEQREHVEVEIEVIRAEFQERIENGEDPREMMRRGLEGREGRGAMDRERGGPEGRRGGERSAEAREARMRRIQERINELPPEQRERVLEAIERILERGERGRQRPDPPSMRDVDIPA